MAKMWKSAYSLSKDKNNLEVVFYIDNDDQLSLNKTLELQDRYDHIEYIVGERIVLSEMWNVAYTIGSGPIFMHCGDDIIFRTQNWDLKVRKAFNKYNDKIVFAFGDDGAPNTRIQNFGTHGFIHQNWIDAVGYFVPPYFSSDYNDVWLNDIADAIGRKVNVDILTEHMHPTHGKGSWDQTHQERLIRAKKDNVHDLYPKLAHLRNEDVEKLEIFMEQYANRYIC